jgi:hypothetical protein
MVWIVSGQANEGGWVAPISAADVQREITRRKEQHTWRIPSAMSCGSLLRMT